MIHKTLDSIEGAGGRLDGKGKGINRKGWLVCLRNRKKLPKANFISGDVFYCAL